MTNWNVSDNGIISEVNPAIVIDDHSDEFFEIMGWDKNQVPEKTLAFIVVDSLMAGEVVPLQIAKAAMKELGMKGGWIE